MTSFHDFFTRSHTSSGHDSSARTTTGMNHSSGSGGGYGIYSTRETLVGPLLQRTGLYSDGAYTVTYDSKNDLSVLLQSWGSIWPKVLPYCIWNCAIDIVLQILKNRNIINLSVSDKGHSFINIVMGFLMVSRLNVALARFTEARKYLATMYTETMELVQQSIVYSMAKDEVHNEAKKWRSDLAYYGMTLFRSVQACLDYPSQREPVWRYITDEKLRKEIKDKIFVYTPRFSHAVGRGDFEEQVRIPSMIEMKVRETIQRHYKIFKDPFIILQERALHTSVDRFMMAWTGSRYLLTTPHPFPLVQMTRTFLYLYVFTLPFALLSDLTSPVGHVMTVFIITYGYVGLEMVAIELDDPFGKSANNFQNLRFAYTCFENIYMMIMDSDGEEYALELRRKMDDSFAAMTDEDDVPNNESSGLLG